MVAAGESETPRSGRSRRSERSSSVVRSTDGSALLSLGSRDGDLGARAGHSGHVRHRASADRPTTPRRASRCWCAGFQLRIARQGSSRRTRACRARGADRRYLGVGGVPSDELGHGTGARLLPCRDETPPSFCHSSRDSRRRCIRMDGDRGGFRGTARSGSARHLGILFDRVLVDSVSVVARVGVRIYIDAR